MGHKVERGERLTFLCSAHGIGFEARIIYLDGVWIRRMVSHSFRLEKSSVVCLCIYFVI